MLLDYLEQLQVYCLSNYNWKASCQQATSTMLKKPQIVVRMSDMLTKLPIKSHAFSKPNIMDEGFESQLQFHASCIILN